MQRALNSVLVGKDDKPEVAGTLAPNGPEWGNK